MQRKSFAIPLLIVGAIVLFGIVIAGVIIVYPMLRGSDSDNDKNTDDDSTDKTDDDNDEKDESEKYAVVVGGKTNDDLHYGWFRDSSRQAYEMLQAQGYTDENIYYLFESEDEPDVDMTSTLDNFNLVIETIDGKIDSNDQLVLIFIGHGGYRGGHSFYSLADEWIYDNEMADLLDDIKRDKLVVVFSPCNAGGFIDDLSGDDTVVITSTRADESNKAAFIEPFLSAFSGVGDLDSDGKVSVGEAYNYAADNVLKQYETNGWGSLTEHAQIDDNGDNTSHEAPVPNQGDGQLALSTYL